MTMTGENMLHFVTWNIRGIKNPKQKGLNFPKLHPVLKYLKKINSSVVFLQETHIGDTPNDVRLLEEVAGWKSYFTVFDSKSKGVAILINNDIKPDFQYICHDEDYAGGYIVLFCRLYGQLFTLVNVYNHTDDHTILEGLNHYLQETATGILVVAGDFNTVLDPDLDRNSTSNNPQHNILRDHLEIFISSLSLVDIWSRLHPMKIQYTFKSETKSRLDMFFMQETIEFPVDSCEICEIDVEMIGKSGERQNISDHKPVSLKLCLLEALTSSPEHGGNITEVSSMLREFGYSEKRKEKGMRINREPGKISGAEVLMALKSLTNYGQPTPDGLKVDHYKRFCFPMTEILKINYNLILQHKSIPEPFKNSIIQNNRHLFNVDYLIFSKIISSRLGVYMKNLMKKKTTRKTHSFVTFKKVTQLINWPFLMEKLEPIKPSSIQEVLKELLPNKENKETLGSIKCLRSGCPLTQAILMLSLTHLAVLISEKGWVTSICHHRRGILIYMRDKRQRDKISQSLLKLLLEFRIKSGLRVIISGIKD